MSVEGKTSEPSQEKSKDGSNTSTVHQTIWQLNEPIDVDAYEPTTTATLPVITKVESINVLSKPSIINQYISKSKKNKAMVKVCEVLGFNPKLNLHTKRNELKKRKKVYHGINMSDSKVKSCKSIFLSKLPLWFDTVHVMILMQLASEFDENSDNYYIDIVKDFSNKKTGECLIRFTKNKECLKFYKALQGIQLKNLPLLVNLDIDHIITDCRDRLIQNTDERFIKFKLRCENEIDQVQVGHEIIVEENLQVKCENYQDYVQVKLENDDVQLIYENKETNVQVKSEIEENMIQDNSYIKKETKIDASANINTVILGHSPELEPLKSNLQKQPETNDNTKKDKAKSTITSGGKKSNQSKKQNVGDEVIEEPIVYDHNFFNCKTVHIKNLLGICKSVHFHDLVNSWIKKDVGIDEDFSFWKVTKDDGKTPTGDVIVELPTHRLARKVCKQIDGLEFNNRKLSAVVAVGYERQQTITESDLKRFALKRKSLYDGSGEGSQPAKRQKTETPPPSTSERVEEYETGFMDPEDRCFEVYGLSAEFMRKLNVKVPLSRTVVVHRLHFEVDEAKLQEVFSLAGQVQKITITADPARNQWKKARIEFDHPLEAVQAISMLHKQKLYNKEMYIEMQPVFQHSSPLPLGLAGIGPGLSFNGGPLRGLRTFAEFMPIHEMFADIGCMMKTSYNDQPIKFSYKKCKPKESLKNLYFDSKASHSTKSQSDKSASSTSKSSERVKSRDAEISKDALAIHTLGVVLVNQGLIPSTTNCSDSQSILTALIANRSKEKNSKSNEKNLNVSNNALIDALSQVIQLKDVNGQNNSAQNFQNVTPSQVSPVSGNVYPAYGNLPSRFDIGPNGSPAPMMTNVPGTDPVLPPQQIRPRALLPLPLNPELPRNFGPPYPGPPRNLAPLNPGPTQNMVPPNSGPPQNLLTMNIAPPQSLLLINTGLPRNVAPIIPGPQRNLVPIIPEPPRNIVPPNPEPTRNLVPINPAPPQNLPQIRPMTPTASNIQNQNPSRQPVPPGTTKEKNPSNSSSSKEESFKKSEMLAFKNLPASVTTDALTAKMSEIGEIRFCEMTGQGKAFVRFCQRADAERCIRLFHRSKVDGQVIHVSFL